MKNVRSTLCLMPLLLLGLYSGVRGAKLQETLRQPSLLVRAFVNAEAAPTWRPDRNAILLARKLLKSRSPGAMDRAASHYCLAMANLDRESNVTGMVKWSLRTGPGETEFDDGRSALPDALGNLFLKWRSRAAALAIVSHELDGASGEMLGMVRLEAFVAEPRLIAQAWRSARSGKAYLPDQLAEEASDDAEFRRSFMTDLHSPDPALRALARAVVERLRRHKRSRR